MYENLKNQRVVVTGITGGIAFETTKLLASLGAEVIVTARSQDKLDTAISQIEGNVKGEILDLKDEASIKALFEKVGEFDHLVTPAASSTFAPIAEMDFAAAKEIIETKQWGQLMCVHHALPKLSKTGSITLFSGTVTQKPLPGSTMFAQVGAATEAAARIWAFESAPVRVNTIVPGVIDTRVWSDLLGEEAAKATIEQIGGSLPVGRAGTPEEVAKGVLFLIDNGFANGISLVLDGGHRLV